LDGLGPHADDVPIVKRRLSIFFGTELDQILRRLKIETGAHCRRLH
jgi:nicotinamidase-related amidase